MVYSGWWSNAVEMCQRIPKCFMVPNIVLHDYQLEAAENRITERSSGTATHAMGESLPSSLGIALARYQKHVLIRCGVDVQVHIISGLPFRKMELALATGD